MWINPKEHKVVGEVLSGYRRRAGLTQEDVAVRLAKPQSFVSAYENGQRRIDVLELARIAQAIEADPVDLITEIWRRQG